MRRVHDAAAVLADPGVVGRLVEAIHAAKGIVPTAFPDNTDPADKPPAQQESKSGSGSEPEGQCADESSATCKWEAAPDDAVEVMVSGAGHDAMAMAEITKVGA